MSESYWEERYRSRDMPWEKGSPSPGLVDFLNEHLDLARGTVCVPGCGTGHDVRAWASAGFEVYGYDIAPSAIRLAKTATSKAGLKARFARKDFLTGELGRRFLWVFEHTLFCAINPADRDRYVSALLRNIEPMGWYLAVFYLIPDEDGPPFGTTRDEICRRFSPHFDLKAEWVPRSYPNRTGLELMMWWQHRPGTAE